MKTFTKTMALFSFMMVLASIGIYGAEPAAELNETQQKYFDWTNKNFGAILNADAFSDLSESAKAEVGRHFHDKLISLLDYQNTGGGYQANDFEKWTTINTLAEMNYQPAVDDILKVAVDNQAKDNRERWMAVRALGRLKAVSAAPRLIHLIYHYNMNTRIWAQIVLVQLTGRNFGYDWQAWGKWWNEQGKEPAFNPEKIDWVLPPNADPQWADPEYQQKQDAEAMNKM